MSSHEEVSRGWERLATLLIRAGRDENLPAEGKFVNPPVTRGSTVLFPDLASLNAQGMKRYDHEAIYGAMGTPVQHVLERAVALVEGGEDTQIVSSGLSACTTALLTFTASGGHVLIPDSAYGPTRRFTDTMLRRFGVETTYYPPCVSVAEMERLIRPETQVIFAESPGSHTFEIQDIPALSDLAHRHGALLILDNTWGFGIFEPFRHGVDVSVQALTKYAAGHSDAIIGALTVADKTLWKRLRDAAIQLGQLAGPDECWLTLRGLRTMSVRLARQSCSALDVARWLADRPEVERVLHPALPDFPGYELWKRDFNGAGPLFSVVLKERYSRKSMENMLDSLHLFGIGASWGGFESLVLPTTGSVSRTATEAPVQATFRLNIGLESVRDLCGDLEQGFSALNGS
ncbi:cystathionine beta-lyase [Acetobacter sp. AN02]|uniref:cystathionine beta-lyase n=1 Tax=Acetobacter sp. AN02 TaxID=2894186 RepID=UPI0024342F7E|nr:cystathionine beta-lyase [Acetobacter sp. AN02]MDG6093939.1 cystathionine beta-lyase [Acetobacter sp. AN02]